MSESVVEGGERPSVNIVGEKVALGPLRRDSISLYRHWMNDFETIRGYDMPRPLTDEAIANWFERASTSENHILFTLYERETMRPIGHTGLLRVDRSHRNGEFDLFIGEPESRGKGYGSEATRLVLDFAFNGLGFQSVYLRVLEFNAAGIRAYEKAGFQHAGRLRQNWFVGGKFWDLVYMDCVASDFASSKSVMFASVDP